MNILVACKIVPDDQDIKATADGSLDFSKAHMVVSSYDKNAIEAATKLANGGYVKVMTVGGAKIDEGKVKKDILARGVDELYMVASEGTASLDAFGTAAELASLAGQIGDYDAIVVGSGSADLYAQQTGVQLAAALNLPYVSGIISGEVAEGKVVVRRLLESEVEIAEVPTPCVLAITPDFAPARICGMKDILAAGKKPMNAVAPAGGASATVEVSVKAPKAVDRKQQIVADVAELAAAIKAAL